VVSAKATSFIIFDNGRKNPTTGLYAPRPWYEIEITSESKDRESHFYPKSELKEGSRHSRTGYFTAFIQDNGTIYKIKMFVGSDHGKAIASATESGGRATLGKIIKGKLERARCLSGVK